MTYRILGGVAALGFSMWLIGYLHIKNDEDLFVLIAAFTCLGFIVGRIADGVAKLVSGIQ